MLLPKDSVINAAASGVAANGNITVTGNIIQLGSLVADAGGGTSGGAITVTTGINPNVIDGAGGGVLFDSTGSIVNGGSFGASGNVPSGSGGLLTIGQGNQTIQALGDINLINRNEINVNLGTGQSNTFSTRAGNIGMHNSGLFLYLIAKSVTTNGGDLSISANGIVSLSVASGISTKPASGSGGSVLVTCGGNKDAQISASGLVIDTRGTGIGDGGDVTFQMPANLLAENDPIDLGNGSISTAAAGGGSDGDVSITGATSTLTVGTIQAGHGNVHLATQTGAQVDIRGNITAGDLSIDSGSKGITTPSSNLILTVDNLAFNSSFSSQEADGAISIRPLTATQAISIGNLSSGLSLSLSELAGLHTGTLAIGSNASSGGITLSGDIVLPANLSLTNSGGIVTTACSIDTNQHNLSMQSSSTVNLGAIQGDTGSVAISASGSITFDANVLLTGSGATLLVESGGLLSSNADLSSGVIALEAGSGFAVSGDITASQALTLSTGVTLTNAQLTGALNSSTLNLATFGGASIGSNVDALTVAGNVARVSIDSSFAAYVRRIGESPVELLQSSVAGDFELTADGALLISSHVETAHGSIMLTNRAGELRVAADAVISANGPDAHVSLINTGNSKSVDSIAIGHGATIEALASNIGSGNVLIQLGDPTPLLPSTKPPHNVTYNLQGGGQILFGGPGNQVFVTSSKRDGVNAFNAKGANISISNHLKKRSISFEGSITITADPPLAAAKGLTDSEPVDNGGASNEMRLTKTKSVSVDADCKTGNQSVPGIDFNWLGITPIRVLSGLDNGSIQEDSLILLPDVVGQSGQPRESFSSSIEFKSGAKLIAPVKDTVVNTAFGAIKISSGAVVLIVVCDETISVFDVTDRHKKSVVFESNNRSIVLAPGRHLTVSARDADRFAQVNPVEAVLHRDLKKDVLGTGCAYQSEFSMPSLFAAVRPLQKMMIGDTDRSKRMADEIVKTSAILLHLSSNRPFEYHIKPQAVALTQR